MLAWPQKRAVVRTALATHLGVDDGIVEAVIALLDGTQRMLNRSETLSIELLLQVELSDSELLVTVERIPSGYMATVSHTLSGYPAVKTSMKFLMS